MTHTTKEKFKLSDNLVDDVTRLLETQLDELSKNTLRRYVKVASRDAAILSDTSAHLATKGMLGKATSSDIKKSNELYRKKEKRLIGIERAADKLAEADSNIEYKEGDRVHLGFGAKGGAGFKGKITKIDHANDRVYILHDSGKTYKGPIRFLSPLHEEEIEELSKSLLDRYIKKAHSDMGDKAHKHLDALEDIYNTWYSKDSVEAYDNLDKKIYSRQQNVYKAKRKIKEDVADIEKELSGKRAKKLFSDKELTRLEAIRLQYALEIDEP